jgi:hypothetical protein
MRFPNILATLTLTTLALIASACTVEPSGEVSVDESAICCGSNCCLISAVCYQNGEMNPANSCEQCSPPTQTSWTAVPNCTVDAGMPAVDAGTPSVDAGAPAQDAGAPAQDAGAPAQDAGAPPRDAGTPAADAAAPAVDAGVAAPDAGTEPADDGGCRALAPSLAHPLQWALLAFFAGSFVVRRRRTSR